MENKQIEKATFAGGCFWCVESAFSEIEGVLNVVSGYTGGDVVDPTYEQVCSGDTGHYEVVQVSFNPDVITYKGLLKVFFQQIDPTDEYGSFVDKGSQYKSAVFYHTELQQKEAIEIMNKIDHSGLFDDPVATQVIELETFYKAEAYQQGYHKSNPTRYKFYRAGSGRDPFIDRNANKFNKIFNDDETNNDKTNNDKIVKKA